MKILVFLSTLFITLPSLAKTNISRSKNAPLKIHRKRSFPKIQLNLGSKLSSNIEGTPEPINKNIVSHSISVKTKIKGRPFKRFILIYLPTLETEFAPSLTKTLKVARSTNSLIGLYLPKRGLVFNSTLNMDYSDSYVTNEDGILENSRYTNLAFSLGAGHDFKHGLGLDYGIKTKLQNYLIPLSSLETEEEDSLKVEANIRPKFKLNKKIQVNLNLKYSKKWFKEKRAVLENGADGGAQAETIDQYQATLNGKFKQGPLLFGPSFGLRYNKDMENNGKTYKGPQIGILLGIFGEKITFNSKWNYKRRKYESGQIDTFLALGESEKLKLDIIHLKNDLYYMLNTNSKINVGYDLILTDSNSAIEENTNHVFKLGLNIIL